MNISIARDEDIRPEAGGEATIVALASGVLPSGIAVIRMSGSKVCGALRQLAGGVPAPRRASLRTFVDGSGAVIDTGIVLYFPGPTSPTGEDCGEFHVHGGRAVVAAMIAALQSVPEVRLAEPGEFAKRALINGRNDLLGTEALADLIDADTEAERRFAVENGRERHRALYEGWRTRILRARAMVEAELDFSDEDDVPSAISDSVWGDVQALIGVLDVHLQGYQKATIVRDGYDVVIIGPPNAGKSSLLNWLVDAEVAIVTEEAGTTRDLVTGVIAIDGAKVRLTDTAGLRDAESKAELIGIERSRQRAKEADLVLSVYSPSDGQAPLELAAEEGRILIVATKADVLEPSSEDRAHHVVSVETGTGFRALLTDIGDLARAAHPRQDELVPWRQRHVELLADCRESLQRSLELKALELRSEDLRLSSLALGRLAGDIGVEDMLDEIFSSFCIGK